MRVFLFCFFLCGPALCWDRQGHQDIATIAWHYMTPTTQQKIKAILKDETLVDVSDWADRIRGSHRFTTWHYTSLKTPNALPSRPGNLYHGLTRSIQTLNHQNPSLNEKEALKLLVHLVGDMHQPLHIGNGLDHGANDCQIRWYHRKKPVSLHRVWDHFLIQHLHGQQKDFMEESMHIPLEKRQMWTKGSLIAWMQETRALHADIYPQPIRYCDPKKPYKKYQPHLSKAYTYHALPTVKTQLRKAGVRLAYLLNQIYDAKG